MKRERSGKVSEEGGRKREVKMDVERTLKSSK